MKGVRPRHTCTNLQLRLDPGSTQTVAAHLEQLVERKQHLTLTIDCSDSATSLLKLQELVFVLLPLGKHPPQSLSSGALWLLLLSKGPSVSLRSI